MNQILFHVPQKNNNIFFPLGGTSVLIHDDKSVLINPCCFLFKGGEKIV